MSRPFVLIAGWLLVSLLGCGGKESPKAQVAYSYPNYGQADIKFLDDVQSNTNLDAGIRDLTLLGVDGQETRIESLQGGKHLIVVVTRGNTDPICPYCSTQVADYIRSYDTITSRGAQVIVVYPIEKLADQKHRDAFLGKARELLKDPNRPTPFPVLLDVELKAVDKLGIRKNLSKPATYLLDRNGRVQFAYVGNSLADRPSIPAMLEQLDKLNKASPTQPSSTAGS